MPFPFGKSQKSPADIVRSLKENVAYMEKMDSGDSKKCEKVSRLVSHLIFVCLLFSSPSNRSGCELFSIIQVAEEVSKNLASLKEVLSGTGDKEPQTEAVAQLAQELYNTNLLIALIANLQRIDFEVGKKMLFISRSDFICV